MRQSATATIAGLFMTTRKRKSLRQRMAQHIERSSDSVFLPREFARLGKMDQILRALRQLVSQGHLVRLGYGVYGRAMRSRLSGEPMLYCRNGFLGAAREALTKLEVSWEPSTAERAYNEGRTTQFPVNPVVRVKGRFSRRLRDGKFELQIER
jgi:hypothetical protein